MKIKINDTISQNIQDIVFESGETSNSILLQSILLMAHPVGSYYWSSDSTSPATLFGGTWEQVKDTFIIAAGSTYQAGQSYGSNTKNFSHTHTSAAHTHDVAGHTHTSAAHTHSVNGHTHTSAAHSHTSAAHTHSTGNHTLTVAEMPSHTHGVQTFPYWGSSGNYYMVSTSPGGNVDESTHWRGGFAEGTGGSGAHNHGNTGSTTPGNTGSTTPGATGSTTLTTNSTTPGATGSTTLTTKSTTPGATGSSLSSTFDITPASVAAYCWRRTA